MFDVYLISLQSDILSAIMRITYISIINCASFFHQWLVKMKNRHKLIVISHRDSEQWNVAVMKYRNSSAYVQRQIDVMLRSCRVFARAYVNDVIVFFNFLKEHLRYLNEIFKLFQSKNVVLKTIKTYLEYFSISLLDQKIDSLDLTIVENKLVAIRELQFSRTLKYLKIYLDKIDYLRQYVLYYAQKTQALQLRKIYLLRASSSNKKNTRKRHSQITIVNSSTKAELNSFNQLQDAFSRSIFLIHYDRTRTLFVDVDVSKERDYEVIIYHVKMIFENLSKSSHRQMIESILFLSKMLALAKQRYWLTELKMTTLIWFVRKLRLIILSFDHLTIVYTNHVVNSTIVNQTKLTSSNMKKLNIKLIRAFIYLSQFRL